MSEFFLKDGGKALHIEAYTKIKYFKANMLLLTEKNVLISSHLQLTIHYSYQAQTISSIIKFCLTSVQEKSQYNSWTNNDFLFSGL
jgi:hypothetical protein